MMQNFTGAKVGRRRVNRPLLVVVIFVALLARLAISPFINELMSPEHINCWEQGNVAASLVAGHGFGNPFDATVQSSAIMPPVFPLIVALCFKLFGVRTVASVVAVHAFDCFVSALACIPVFLMARHSFGLRVAWWAAWAWALSPYGIYFSATWPWSTHLLLLCLCWLLVLAQQMEHSSRLALWAGFGLLAGFAGLTEPSILVVIPFLLALACWRLARDGKRWLVPGCVAGIVMAAALSPWMIRNAMVFHRFIPMRDGMGLELWLGNNGRTLHWTNTDLHPMHDMQEQADYDRGELAYMDRKMQLAKGYIGSHRAWYAARCLRRAVYLWTGYWSFNPAYLAEESMDYANIPYSTVLTLLGLLGLYMAWHSTPFEAIRYAGVLVFFPLMYYFIHPETYRMRPLDPLIAILGCQAILAVHARARGAARAKSFQPVPDLAEAPAAD